MSPDAVGQSIHLHPQRMALVRFGPGEGLDLVQVASKAAFFTFIRTPEESSFVVEEQHVPRNAPKKSKGWRLLQIRGPFPLDVIGVLASVTAPLAAAKVSIFALATFDTDYFLIQGRQLQRAVAALRKAGHTVTGID